MAVQITRQLAEQHPEQVREQRAREVEPLLAEVVAVVELPALERGEQEPVDHVPEEVRLLRFGALGHRDVREHLLLQDLLRVPQPPLARKPCGYTTVANEVEGDLGCGLI
jgi:hypothetical protein